MVNNMKTEYLYAVVDEAELDEILSGHGSRFGSVWLPWASHGSPRPGSIGVIWQRETHQGEAARPLVLISHEEDIRRLCGRYAQLRNDLSPLTTWCHIITPRIAETLDDLVRVPELGGLQAAWSGLIVAEAVLLAERPVASVRISACLATQSFAVARTCALWNHISVEEIMKRFDLANQLCRSDSAGQRAESRVRKLSTSLQPLWNTLLGLSHARNATRSNEVQPFVDALQALGQARQEKDKFEAAALVRPLLALVPEAKAFEQLTDLTPELRLRLFDTLILELNESKGDHSGLQQDALKLLAGYLATVAAGGAPSLSLVESHALRWPEITAWAYLIGGIGESVVWTSSFDGLGRLVARELFRPARFSEAPTCDFGFDEAVVLADSKLSDPLVHLRIKQARLVTVALFPGVNVSIPIAESATARIEPNRVARPSDYINSTRDPMAALLDAFWPYLRVRMEDYLRVENSQRERKKKTGPQANLPLGTSKKTGF